jgi:hypothetical protein
LSEFQRSCPFPFKKKRRRAKIKGYVGFGRRSTYFLMHKCRVGSDNNKMLICFKDIYVNRLPVTIAKKVADRARKLENLSGQNSTKKFGATYY